ncbi:pfEMP1 [Plasmodium falciparum HB3]|uniref:PfEMP1 n=1 Tax=Plasmodium falciparum (isolate HB3) TaxID=137071 RepID=A0A0L7KLK0_PLAFX|nr:pfEMP1 [Plasmodium falciparum HB3]
MYKLIMRQRLYLSNLKTLAEGATKIQLRQAFIETAAVETFFAWHEFKKEKEKEIKEEAELVYKTTGPNEHDQKLESGEIPEEFKHQMFYTFGDYRDLCLGKDICKDMSDVQKNIKNVFENADRGIGKRDAPKEWWEKNAKDIWEGMLCALSYDTETKELKNGVRTQVNAEKNNYKNIKFTQKSGRNGQELEAFVSRPQFIRWFEEWAEDFSRKQSYKLKKIQNECQGVNGGNNCDDDGFDCDQMHPNKEGTFENFTCLSCAKSCRFYKKWINTKKSEFEKQQSKYHNKISDSKINVDNIYDKVC